MKCLAFFFYDEPGWGGFLFAFLGVPPHPFYAARFSCVSFFFKSTLWSSLAVAVNGTVLRAPLF